jgi:hypothetical protein
MSEAKGGRKRDKSTIGINRIVRKAGGKSDLIPR